MKLVAQSIKTLLFIGILPLILANICSSQVTISHPSGHYEHPFTLKFSSPGCTPQFILRGQNLTNKGEWKDSMKIRQTCAISIHCKSEVRDTIFYRTFVFNRPSKLPLVCLNIEPSDLWNYSKGIYTKGKYGQNDTTVGRYLGNYNKDWERTTFVEFIDTNGKGFAQTCGIKIFGETTRRYSEKSMKLIARKKYGKKRFVYKIFGDSEIRKHKQLVLRTSGNDYKKTRFKDVLNAYLIKNLSIDYMNFRQVQLYVNGEWWGLYNLREKINEHYLKSHHGAHKDSTSIVKGRWIEQHGDRKDYMKMYRYFENCTSMDSLAYAKICSQLDIRNYINYRITQIFINNSDSRGNIRYWKAKNLDNRFRMILYDTDASFGSYRRNFLKKSLSKEETDWYNPEWSTMFLRKLITNQSFKNDFVNQASHLLNTVFHKDTIIQAVDHMQRIYIDELPRNSRQLAKHTRYGVNTEKKWLEHVDELRQFAKLRPKHFRSEVNRLLAKKGSFHLNLQGKGMVSINSNYMQRLPFHGTYFKGVPISIEFIPDSGRIFSEWNQHAANNKFVMICEQDTLSLSAITKPAEKAKKSSSISSADYSASARSSEHVSSFRSSFLPRIGFVLILVGIILITLHFVGRSKS